VKEGVISKEISPFYIESGDQFDPLRADLEYEDEEMNQPMNKGLVACSLSIGLFFTRSSRDMDGKIVQTKKEVILKPKVILQETLRMIVT